MARTGPVATSEPAARARPMAAAAERPVIHSTAEGTQVLDGARLGVDLDDRRELYDLVQHRYGCPMLTSPYASETEDEVMELDGGGTRTRTKTLRAGRDQRMEHFRARPPRTTEDPDPGLRIVVSCLECGDRVAIANIE